MNMKSFCVLIYLLSFNLLGQEETDSKFHEVFQDKEVMQIFNNCLHKGELNVDSSSGNSQSNPSGGQTGGQADGQTGGQTASLDEDKANKVRECLKENLGDEKTKQIEDAIAETNDEKNQDAKTGSNTQRDKNPFVSKDDTDQKLLEKVEQALYDRMIEAIYGVDTKKQHKDDEKGLLRGIARIADHDVFYKIYQAQLSRSLISQISSYCADADANAGFLQHEREDRRACVRKENLDKIGASAAGANAAGHWQDCLRVLPYICQQATITEELNKDPNRLLDNITGSVDYSNDPEDSACSFKSFYYPTKDNNCQKKSPSAQAAQPNQPSQNAANNNNSDCTNLEEEKYSSDDLRFSVSNACQIHSNVEAFKKSLVNTEKLNERIDEQRETLRSTGIERKLTDKDGRLKEVEKYKGKSEDDGPGSEKSVDELTTITSGFFDRATKDDQESALSKIEECIKQGSADNCSDYITKPIANADALLVQAQAEIISKANADAKKIEAFDQDELKDYLKKSEGYTDEQIEKLYQERTFEIFRQNVAEAIIDRAYNSASAMKRHKELASKSGIEQLEAKRDLIKSQREGKIEKLFWDNAGIVPELNISRTKDDGTVERISNSKSGLDEVADSAVEKERVEQVKDGYDERGIASSPEDEQGEEIVTAGATIDVSQINEQITPALDKVNPDSGLNQTGNDANQAEQAPR